MTFWLANQTPSHVAIDGKARPLNYIFGNSILEYISDTCTFHNAYRYDEYNHVVSYDSYIVIEQFYEKELV